MSSEETQPWEDATISLSTLRVLVRKFVDERDWNQYHNPKDLSIAISIEVAEMMEHFLFRAENTPKDQAAFSEEMADVFIYLMSLANTLKIENFAEIVKQKMIKNRKKYPIDSSSGNNYKKK